MNKALISLGSNIAEGETNIRKCIELITRKTVSATFSDIFISEPEGSCRKFMYTNCVGEIETSASFEELNMFFKDTETAFGRDRTNRIAGIVPIDIDIVIWNENMIKEKDFNRNFFKKGLSMLRDINI